MAAARLALTMNAVYADEADIDSQLAHGLNPHRMVFFPNRKKLRGNAVRDREVPKPRLSPQL